MFESDLLFSSYVCMYVFIFIHYKLYKNFTLKWKIEQDYQISRVLSPTILPHTDAFSGFSEFFQIIYIGV